VKQTVTNFRPCYLALSNYGSQLASFGSYMEKVFAQTLHIRPGNWQHRSIKC